VETKNTTFGMTLREAMNYLRYKPDSVELDRLVEYFPTYKLAHRRSFLKGFFEGKGVSDLVADKLRAKGIDQSLNKTSKGGHARWVKAKSRRLVIRLLYLRLRLDDRLTKRKANQWIFKNIWSTSAADGGQSNIRKATNSPKLK